MKYKGLITGLLALCAGNGLLAAESGYLAPKTEHGVPDLQGSGQSRLRQILSGRSALTDSW